MGSCDMTGSEVEAVEEALGLGEGPAGLFEGGKVLMGSCNMTGSDVEAVEESLGLGVGPAGLFEGGGSTVSCFEDMGHRRPTAATATPAATSAALFASLQPGAGLQPLAWPGW